MKRLAIFIVALLFLFVSCQNKETKIESLSGEAERVMAALGGKERFIVADEDFVISNFETAGESFGATVCLLREGVGEFGLFLLPDAKSAANFLVLVQKYLANEGDAIRSLAALYPAEELEKRLATYDKALVGKKGTLVYYFALPEEEAEIAIAAL